MPPKAINFQRFNGLETLFFLDDLKDPRALNDLRSGCAERGECATCAVGSQLTRLQCYRYRNMIEREK